MSPMSPKHLLVYHFLFLLLPVSLASQCTKSGRVYRFAFGQINATIIYDGPTIFEQNPFLVRDWQVMQSYSNYFRKTSPILASQNVIVLDTPTSRIIVDPGARGVQHFPFFAQSGLLFDGLTEAGISPKSVDAVLITHGHANHVSGLINPDRTAAFPNADVFISEAEHKFWTSDPFQSPESAPLPGTLNAFGQVYRASIAPYSHRLHLVGEKTTRTRLPYGFHFLPAPGHSPGHVAIQVTSSGHSLIIAGDTWISKPDQIQNPGWFLGTDSNPADASKSRMKLLNLASRRRDLVMAFHEQFPGLGYVSKNGKSFDWIPAPLRFSRE